MKTYRVKVNGKLFQVELEEVIKTDERITLDKNDVTVTKDKGYKVKSFMQGTIVDVKVVKGQTVIKGQTLAILETMKMENEIVSPVAGRISKVYIKKLANVENQEVIMIVD